MQEWILLLWHGYSTRGAPRHKKLRVVFHIYLLFPLFFFHWASALHYLICIFIKACEYGLRPSFFLSTISISISIDLDTFPFQYSNFTRQDSRFLFIFISHDFMFRKYSQTSFAISKRLFVPALRGGELPLFLTILLWPLLHSIYVILW